MQDTFQSSNLEDTRFGITILDKNLGNDVMKIRIQIWLVSFTSQSYIFYPFLYYLSIYANRLPLSRILVKSVVLDSPTLTLPYLNLNCLIALRAICSI